MRGSIVSLALLCSATASALPSSGYATASVPAPDGDLTDFTIVLDLSDMPNDWWTAVDTSDGAKGRAAKDGDETELATNWIEFDDTAETGFVRVKWSGTMSLAGGQTIRIYPPQAANSSYLPSATFGSENAYDADWVGAWPSGGGSDQTANANGASAVGGVTFGGATGKVGSGTDYDGVDDQATVTDNASLDVAAAGTAVVWCESALTNTWEGVLSRYSNATIQGYRLNRRGASDDMSVQVGDGTSNFEARGGAISGTLKHFVGTWSGTNIEIFENSVSVAANAVSITPLDVSQDLQIGFSDATNGTFWDGIIDEIQLHSAVRSDDWIEHEYSVTNDPTTEWGTWTWNAPAAGIAIPVVIQHRRQLSHAD